MIREDVSIPAATDLGPGDYKPDGGTALLDGIGAMIDSIAGKVANAPQTPVVIAVVSDGHENSSHKYKLPQILDMITNRRFSCGWQFLFLSCNEVASKYALSLGIPKNCITISEATQLESMKPWTGFQKASAHSGWETNARCCGSRTRRYDIGKLNALTLFLVSLLPGALIFADALLA
jgi:hypothetical protein